MRLIGADELKDTLLKYNYTTEHNQIFRYIDEQPTGYDVDKVIEKLNNIKKYNLNLADMMLDIQVNGTNRHFICLEDAIEIVKAGGNA